MNKAAVLVVDDEPLVLGFVQTILRHGDYSEVLTAANGDQALRIVEFAPKIDVVLNDVHMP